MAISQVRAQFNGQWYTLIYNDEARAYQVILTPDMFSGNQPGGYYNIAVEAVNDSGAVSVADGSIFSELKLVALETVPPTLTLISPQPGYVTSNMPAITYTAVDDSGGSGIDPSTVSVTQDGSPVPEDQITITVETDGTYIITYTPSLALTDGAHDIAITISDNDGNTASMNASYMIDTVPPEISIGLSFEEVVTDAYTVCLYGHASHNAANPVSVRISNNGGQAKPVELNKSGDFRYTIELDVGENHITVNAADAAGLVTTREYYIIRLITDRTQDDVNHVNELTNKVIANTATDDERAEWFAGMKGAYNATDFNRVNAAMEYINGWITNAGYSSEYVNQGVTWKLDDIQTTDNMNTYLKNVASIGSVFSLSEVPILPNSLAFLTYGGANAMEEILVLTDRLYPLLKRSHFVSGEVFCCEV